MAPSEFPDPPPPEVERFLTYSVRRWGALVDVWELYNERNAPDAWLTALATIMRDQDQYQHPISNSNARPELAAIDINSPHWYGTESALDSDRLTASRAASWRQWDKPVIVGEQGNSTPEGDSWGNWLPDSAVRMRLRSWSALFNEISFLFWNNSWATNATGGGAANLYLGFEERRFVHVLQWFAYAIERTDLHQAPTGTVRGYDDKLVRAHALVSSDGVALYLHHCSDHATVVHSAALTVDAPRAGVGTWIDPATGRKVASVPVVAGANTLAIPDFDVDIAFFTTADADPRYPPLALATIHNPQADGNPDGDLDGDGQPDRGPAEPPFGMPPLTLTLDASASYDPDGGQVQTLWRYGDGTPPSSAPVATHTYLDGKWLTTLRVTDDEGLQAEYSFMVRATADPHPDVNDAPLLNPLTKVYADEGSLVLISPSGADRELNDGSYHVDGHTVEQLEVKAETVPAGARFEAPAGQGAPQLWWVPSYDQAGEYVVKFWVEDPEGAASEPAWVTIVVRDVPAASAGAPTPTPATAAPTPAKSTPPPSPSGATPTSVPRHTPDPGALDHTIWLPSAIARAPARAVGHGFALTVVNRRR